MFFAAAKSKAFQKWFSLLIQEREIERGDGERQIDKVADPCRCMYMYMYVCVHVHARVRKSYISRHSSKFVGAHVCTVYIGVAIRVSCKSRITRTTFYAHRSRAYSVCVCLCLCLVAHNQYQTTEHNSARELETSINWRVASACRLYDVTQHASEVRARIDLSLWFKMYRDTQYAVVFVWI